MAGVSPTTVSRVISGRVSVPIRTRQAVEEAIATLAYSPSSLARALSNGSSFKVGLLHDCPNVGYIGELISSLCAETTQAHLGLTVLRLEDGKIDLLLNKLRASEVRGVIVIPPLTSNDDLTEALRDTGAVVVTVGTSNQATSASCVGIDDCAAAQEMTDHLIAMGHRRIGFITGARTYTSTNARLNGYLQAMRVPGLRVDAEMIVEGSQDYKSGLAAAEHLLGRSEPPTAIFASSDEMAAAAVAVAHRRKIDVPADLSVCGFDDSILATTIWPALTTVRQPVQELACNLISVLERMADRNNTLTKPTKQRIVLDHVIVRRQSDAPPRRRPPALG